MPRTKHFNLNSSRYQSSALSDGQLKDHHWAHPCSITHGILTGLRILLILFLLVSTGYLLFKYVSFGMRIDEAKGLAGVVLEGFKNVPWATYVQAGACLYIFITVILTKLISCCFRRGTSQLKSQNVTSIVVLSLNTLVFFAVGVITAIRIFPGTALKKCDPNVKGLPGTPWTEQSFMDDMMGGFMAEDVDLGGQIGAITDLFTDEKLVCPIYKTDMWVCWILGATFLVEIVLVGVLWRHVKRNEGVTQVVVTGKGDVESGVVQTSPLMGGQKVGTPVVTPGWQQEGNQYQYGNAGQHYYGNTGYDPYAPR